MRLATIGYEGATLSDFIATLIEADVKRVIDVRQIAQSRRPGFSKNALRAALAEVDIDYHHARELGDPKSGREAARAGKIDLFYSIFMEHLEHASSKDALRSAISLAMEKKSALVCFERDPKQCHRTIVARHIVASCSLEIEHLGVRIATARRGVINGRTADRLIGAC